MDLIRYATAPACAIAMALSLPAAARADHGASHISCERTGEQGARAALVLKHSYINKRGDYIGVFELRNEGISPALALPGIRRGRGFTVGPPDRWMDFRDVNGTWKMLWFGPISHYLPRPHALVVKPHTTVRFDAYLYPRQLLRTEGARFKLTVYSTAPRHCVVSLPFTAFPAPAPITEFVSDPVPPVPGRFGEPDEAAKLD